MKYCDKCKIKIDTKKTYCPLCQQTLSGEISDDLIEKYPEYISVNRKVYPVTKRIIMFVTIVSMIILLVINFATYNGRLWSLIPIGSIFYFWILVSVGIFSKANIAFRLATLTSLLIALLVLIDEASLSEGWSYNYLMPILLTVCNLAISVIILIKRIDYRDYILYLLTIVIFSIIPIVLVFFKVITIIWPSLIAFGLAISILLFIIFFFPKSIKDEIKKRFHA